MPDDLYLIWSNEHAGWWGPGSGGYVQRIENAGRYSHDAAMLICCEAMLGRRGFDPLPEFPVRLADAEHMLSWFANSFRGIDPEPPE